jgi:hypothetical protein
MSPVQRAAVASAAVLAVVAGTAASAAGADAPPAGRPTVTVHGRTYAAPNPYLADLPAGAAVDWSYWRDRLTSTGRRRAVLRARAGRVPAPFAYTEGEGPGRTGVNDKQADSERIGAFGVARASQAVKVTGRLAEPALATRVLRTREDQGSMPRATHTWINTRHPRVTVSSRIGDGPHGRARSRHGDFDFYRVRATAGRTITAATAGSRVDTVLVVYDARGKIRAVNDDVDDKDVSSKVSYDVRTSGYYYVMVAGFSDHSPTPTDPSRSGSGRGAGDEGAYRLSISSAPVDRDYYGVHLDAGDVLGGVLTGGARTLTVHRTDGRTMVGSELDASSAYPPQSPLPGGGATIAYVAKESGWYAVSVRGGTGRYGLLMEAYRPGAERDASGAVQTVFLDFDGERLNTGIFGGTGVSTLAPFSSFLPRWGLTRADESAVVRRVLAGVQENIDTTLAARGSNPDVRVRVVSSGDEADPFGQPNVSRVVVGGTIRATGVPTIGIAQSIDVGNYAHEETAMVLLDEVSQPAGPADSFNTYLTRRSDRVAFVSRALSNVISHEIGHFVGSFHTDNLDRTVDLMDAGGENFDQMYGVGPDRVGGTADDTDVNFGLDVLSRDEGFTGLEDTLNDTAWAFRPGATP